jgi:NaMN:DMB phosphoribosyltransferase
MRIPGGTTFARAVLRALQKDRGRSAAADQGAAQKNDGSRDKNDTGTNNR